MHNLNLIPGKVRFVWIKAHVGHEGNERADDLAKTGTLLPNITQVALPKQATKAAIKLAIDEIWDFQWSQYHDGRQSKQFFPLPNRNKAKYCYHLNRQELGRLIRIVTGHNNPFYHRSNVDKTRGTSPLCRFCQEERETFYHFATNCPCFRLSRFHYFQNDTCFTNGSWSIRQILDFSNIPSIANALGGNFDPLVHLEQQRDFEDLIEAEQHDADLQPGRRHNPDDPVHDMSDSESEDPSASDTQYIAARAFIQHAQSIHNISSSDSSDGEVMGPLTTSQCAASGANLNPSHQSVIRRPLGPDAGSRVAVSSPRPDELLITRNNDESQMSLHEPNDMEPRRKINYDTLEITDDEYLDNITDDDSD